mmetsp:Transcript_63569/g.160430  ORF Transcript_63569/g.160430 Transcript_63569/m.160430 type:complete len:219 (-) Transcript_63569:426-1082(-)
MNITNNKSAQAKVFSVHTSDVTKVRNAPNISTTRAIRTLLIIRTNLAILKLLVSNGMLEEPEELTKSINNSSMDNKTRNKSKQFHAHSSDWKNNSPSAPKRNTISIKKRLLNTSWMTQKLAVSPFRVVYWTSTPIRTEFVRINMAVSKWNARLIVNLRNRDLHRLSWLISVSCAMSSCICTCAASRRRRASSSANGLTGVQAVDAVSLLTSWTRQSLS